MFLLATTNYDSAPKQFSSIKIKNQFKLGNSTLSLGGIVNPELSFRRQTHKLSDNKRAEAQNVELINPHFNITYTKIYFQAQYSQESWNAGYQIGIHPSVDELKVDRNYIELFHRGFGTIHLGFQKGVHDLFAKLAQRNMPTIWIYGGLDDHLDKPLEAYAGNELEGNASNAFKFNWISPRYLGMRFAFTYAPHTQVPNTKNENAPFGYHHFTFVLSCQKQLGDFSLQVAGAILGEFYASEKKHRALSYMISASLGWHNLKGALEFLDSGISRLPLYSKEEETKGKALNFSFSYAINEQHTIGVGAQYTWCYKNKEKKEKSQKYDKILATFAYAYKIFECSTWYVEGSFLSYHSSGAQPINEGFVVRTGLRLEI